MTLRRPLASPSHEEGGNGNGRGRMASRGRGRGEYSAFATFRLVVPALEQGGGWELVPGGITDLSAVMESMGSSHPRPWGQRAYL